MVRSKRDEKVDEAEIANRLLAMLADWKEDKEKELLANMLKQDVGDIATIQAEYKACINLISWLKAKIAVGKIATAQIKKERDLKGGK